MGRVLGPARLIPVFRWGITAGLPIPIGRAGQAQLADGRCLTIGGVNTAYYGGQGVQIDTCFLFSADGLTFTTVGNLPNPGLDLRATRLGDGRILAVDGVTWSAQTFDPNTLVWTAQPSMTNAGALPSLVTLNNGNALRLGGNGTNTVEEYLQGSDTWVSRADLPVSFSYVSNAIVMSNGDVFIRDFSNDPVIYNPGSDQWFNTTDLPQGNNKCQVLVNLPNGKLFTAACLGSGYVADQFDPIDRTFSPLPSYDLNTHSQSIDVLKQNGFYLGEGLIAIFDPFTAPRAAYYDYRHRVWYAGGFDQDPEATYNGESLWRQDGNTYQLGQYGFLTVGNTYDFQGKPHFSGRYAELSDRKLNEGGNSPTFAGVGAVVKGTSSSKVFVTWPAASDSKIHVDDLYYYVYWSLTSGGQDFNSPNRHTEIWGGTLSREIEGLTPGVPHYFVVRARNLLTFGTPGNFEFNSNELVFTPNTIAAPTFSWTATVPMNQTRMGLVGSLREDGRFHVWGGITNLFDQQGDIYSQTGLRVDPSPSAVSVGVTESAALDASPENSGGHHRPTNVGGAFGVNTTSEVLKNYPYTDFWFNNLGVLQDNNSAPKNMNDAVYRHTAVALPFGDILRIGGTTEFGNVGTTTNSVERMFYQPRFIYYTNPSGAFTVGLTVTGSFSTATAVILGDFAAGYWVIHYNTQVGSFAVGEVVTGQTFGGIGTVLRDIKTGGSSGILHLTDVTGSGLFATGESILGDIAGDALVREDSNSFFGPTTSPALYVRITSDTVFRRDNFFGTEPITDTATGAADTVAETSDQWQRWEQVTPMAFERFWHSSVVLNDGRVLVVGGQDETGTPLLNAEIYDPATNSWTTISTGVNTHYQFPMVKLLDGRVLCVGGGSTKVDIFDATLAGTPTAHTDNGNSLFHFSLDEASGDCFDSVGVIVGPIVLTNYGATSVAGQVGNARAFTNDTMDADTGFTPFSVTDFTIGFIYKPTTQGASNIVDFSFGGPTTINVSEASMSGELQIRLDDGVDSVILDTVSAGIVDGDQHHIVVTRSGAVVTLYVNSVSISLTPTGTFPSGALDTDYLYIGGYDGVMDDFWLDTVEYTAPQVLAEYNQLFPPAGGGFVAAADLDSIKTEHTALMFGDGKVGVFGGRVAGIAVNDVRLYNPILDSWSTVASMIDARCRHVSFLLPNNKALVVGGEDASGNPLDTAEISS